MNTILDCSDDWFTTKIVVCGNDIITGDNMNLSLLIILAILLIIIPVIVAFGKVIGAGGNPDDLLPHNREPKIVKIKGRSSQILRTIAGIFFSMIILSPVSFMTVRGRPLVNIDHEILLVWISAIVLIEAILFVMIKMKDRN